MSLPFTPKFANSVLRIEAICVLSLAAAGTGGCAIFQEGVVDALAAAAITKNGGSQASGMTISHFMSAGSTDPRTIKFRAGPNAGTFNFNGLASALYGGVAASSITITEIAQ